MIATFDLEISRPVDFKNGGWDAARRGDCGISCLVVWDSVKHHPFVYDEFTLEDGAKHLESASRIVSFNGISFDIPCLEGVLQRRLVIQSHYDILQRVWNSLGKRQKGYGLDDICKRLFGHGKIAEGAHAPKLYAEGRWGELISYCISDVYLTKKLYDHIVDVGAIKDVDGHELWVEQPLEADEDEL